jgi:hypothetical protein
MLGSYVEVFKLRNTLEISIFSPAFPTMGRTYKPGLPVHVEKLKKYRAKPIASPGASEDPEKARSAFAT